jgi:hypothetical protein
MTILARKIVDAVALTGALCGIPGFPDELLDQLSDSS